MSIRTNRRGFTHFELLLVIVVLGAITFIGYMVANRLGESENTDHTYTINKPEAITPPAIKQTSDLDAAEKALDQNDPSTTNRGDSDELDAEFAEL